MSRDAEECRSMLVVRLHDLSSQLSIDLDEALGDWWEDSYSIEDLVEWILACEHRLIPKGH